MSDNQVDDDDGLLDRVGDAVEDVLATDLAPSEPEDRWERRQRILDSWTAILLAVAAVAATWASFQASQWSGTQSDAQSASAMQRSDAGRASSEATSAQILDSQMWLSWLGAVANRQDARAQFFRERFSPSLAAAQTEWVGSARVNADGVPSVVPPGTPMDLPSYVVPAQVRADELAASAEASLAEADAAAGNSTRFVLLAVVFALSLFFASIATKFSQPRLQVLLVLAALALLAFGVIRMLLLPQSL